LTLPAHHPARGDGFDVEGFHLERDLQFAIFRLSEAARRAAAPLEGYPKHGQNCICPACGLCRALAEFDAKSDALREWIGR
jgi:hypothetical protein